MACRATCLSFIVTTVTHLTHDSQSGRNTQCSGGKHKDNVKDYYQKWMGEQAQSGIDKNVSAFVFFNVLFKFNLPTYSITPSAHLIKYEQLKLTRQETTNVDEDVEKGNSLALLVGMQAGVATLENSVEVPREVKNRATL